MPSALLPWIFPLSVETTGALPPAGAARVTAAAVWPCPGAADKRTLSGRTAASPATERTRQDPILSRLPGVLPIMTTSRLGGRRSRLPVTNDE